MQWIPNEKKEPPEAGDYIEVTGRWGKRFVEILDPIKGNGDIVRFYFDPPQPEQESDDLTAAYMSGVYDGKNKYAPQRTWVGLTDEEKHQLNDALNLQGRFPIIDAIEAKLREKNT